MFSDLPLFQVIIFNKDGDDSHKITQIFGQN